MRKWGSQATLDASLTCLLATKSSVLQKSMTISSGQVLWGLLDSVPLYGFCTAIRQVKLLCQRFLGTQLFALLLDTATKSSVFTPNQKEKLCLITGHWLSQLTPQWGKLQQLLFFGHLEHTWPCMWPSGTANLLFCCWLYSGKWIGKKGVSGTCSQKAVFSKSSSLQLFLSISRETSTL